MNKCRYSYLHRAVREDDDGNRVCPNCAKILPLITRKMAESFNDEIVLLSEKTELLGGHLSEVVISENLMKEFREVLSFPHHSPFPIDKSSYSVCGIKITAAK